jgi:hypothetical protein
MQEMCASLEQLLRALER